MTITSSISLLHQLLQHSKIPNKLRLICFCSEECSYNIVHFQTIDHFRCISTPTPPPFIFLHPLRVGVVVSVLKSHTQKLAMRTSQVNRSVFNQAGGFEGRARKVQMFSTYNLSSPLFWCRESRCKNQFLDDVKVDRITLQIDLVEQDMSKNQGGMHDQARCEI